MKLKRPVKVSDVLKIARACIEGGNYGTTFHAQCRQREREVTALDALYVVRTGHRVPARDEYHEEYEAWNYAIEGDTLQGDKLRVIISFEEDLMLVITVIKLTKKRQDHERT